MRGDGYMGPGGNLTAAERQPEPRVQNLRPVRNRFGVAKVGVHFRVVCRLRIVGVVVLLHPPRGTSIRELGSRGVGAHGSEGRDVPEYRRSASR